MTVAGAVLYILIEVMLLVKMNYVTLYINLFVLGFDSPLLVSLPYFLLIEVVAPKKRACYNMIINIFDSSSTLVLAVLFQFGKNWWILFWLNLGLCALGLLILLFGIKESPKFYVSVRQFNKAKQIYSHIAKTNGKSMFKNKLEGEGRDES